MLASLPISTTVFALNLNAQNTTVCNGHYCETTVDLSKYFNTNQINSIKAADWSSKLPRLTGLYTISYRFDGSSVIIYGSVYNNTYWNMPVSTLNIDPWWNITAGYTWTGVDEDTTASTTDMFGYTISLNCTGPTIYAVEIDNNANPTYCMIYNFTNALLSNVSVVGGFATFNYAAVKDKGYYISCNKATASYTRSYKFPYSTYPDKTSAFLTVYSSNSNEGAHGSYPDQNQTNSANNIRRITYACQVQSEYYVANFTLNGGNANLTVLDSQSVNATMHVNITGLNTTIYRNGTVLNTSLVAATTYISTVPAGWWNYTAATNNSDVSTLWINSSTSPKPIDTRVCFKTRDVCVDTIDNKVYIGGRSL